MATAPLGYNSDAIVFAKQGHIALIANEGEHF